MVRRWLLNLYPGEVLGEMAYLEKERTVMAVNMEPSLICVINKKLTRIIGLKIKSHSEKIEEQVFVKSFLKHQDIVKLTACSRRENVLKIFALNRADITPSTVTIN